MLYQRFSPFYYENIREYIFSGIIELPYFTTSILYLKFIFKQHFGTYNICTKIETKKGKLINEVLEVYFYVCSISISGVIFIIVVTIARRGHTVAYEYATNIWVRIYSCSIYCNIKSVRIKLRPSHWGFDHRDWEALRVSSRDNQLTFLMLYILVSIPTPLSFNIVRDSASFCWCGSILPAILATWQAN